MKLSSQRITLERSYRSNVAAVWNMWVTKEGFESWWGPGGFASEVIKLDLRPGGELEYTMTAIGADQIKFMKDVGMPLTSEHKIIFTEIEEHRQLSYMHLADFIPGVDPYDVSTTVEFFSEGDHVRMVLTFDRMHSDEWTQRMQMGMESQLGKLQQVLEGG